MPVLESHIIIVLSNETVIIFLLSEVITVALTVLVWPISVNNLDPI